MIAYNLNTLQSAETLVSICNKYKKDMDINVIHGRNTVDGCSILGVMSLIGHIVSIEVITNDNILKDKFRKEVQNM